MLAALLLHAVALAAPPAVQASCPGLTVTASNNGPTCEGAPVTLTASTNASNPSFHWQCLNCGGPAPGVNYDVQTLTVSNFGSTWEVIVTDNANGCTASARTIPQIESRPLISAPLTWCASDGDVVAGIANDDPNNPFGNITWYVNGGVITSGQGTKTITVHPNTDYPNHTDLGFDIAATSAHGCSFPRTGYWNTVTNVRPEQPLFDLQTSPTACSGNTYQATLIPTASIYTLSWTATNATIVFCQQPYTVACFQPNGPGAATIRATYTTTSVPECPRTVSRTIAVGQGPSAAITADTITTCDGEEAVIPITLSGTPPFTIQWADGTTQAGIQGNVTTRTVHPQTDTDYAIASVSDAGGCSGATTARVTVHVSGMPLILTEPRGAIVPPNTSATLTVQAGGADTLFQWYEGPSGDTSHPMGTLTSTFVTPPVTRPASYWVRVINACGFADSAAAMVAPSTAVRRRVAGH